MGCINCPSERSEMNRREKLISLGVLLCFFTQQSFAANPLDDWHWQNPRPQGNSLLGIGFGQGRFIAVGTSGTIIQSTNSLDWAVIKNPTDQNLYGVGAGNGILVVVGAGGTVLTSTDGSNWTLRSVPSVTSDLKSVTYGNGQFVAVGTGAILTSTDGASWNVQTAGANHYLSSVAFGNGTYVTVGMNAVWMSSPDGVNWSTYSTGKNQNVAVTYGDGSFVALSWTPPLENASFANVSTGSAPGTNYLVPVTAYQWSIAFGKGIFVAVNEFPGWKNIWSSSNGQTWSGQDLSASQGFSAVAFGDGTFVAVAGDEILTSPDGVQWTNRTSRVGGLAFLSGLISVGSTNVVVGGSAARSDDGRREGVVVTATNGVDYATVPLSPSPGSLRDIAVNPSGKVVAVGNDGSVVTSDDLVTWSSRNSATSAALYGVAYGNNQFMAVGTSGTMIVSQTGNVWALRPAVTTRALRDVAYGGGKWLVAGDGGTILSSTNTVDWEPQDSATLDDLYSVGYGGGLFVAVGNNGRITTSSDAVNWTLRSSGVTADLYSIQYGHGVWLAAGLSGTVLSSFDGVEWTRRSVGSALDFYGTGFSQSSFTLIGGGGAILQSDGLDVPLLTLPRFSQSNPFQVYFTGPVGTFRLLGADRIDSTTWSTVLTFTNASGSTRLQEEVSTSSPARFYRVVNP